MGGKEKGLEGKRKIESERERLRGNYKRYREGREGKRKVGKGKGR